LPPQGPPPAPVFFIGSSDTARPSLLQPVSDKFFCEARMESLVLGSGRN
ncbi:hypothetical protein A2U01_0086942, partial [Trifolium medium]|nr:hypothetical protein [Trifolium medium]